MKSLQTSTTIFDGMEKRRFKDNLQRQLQVHTINYCLNKFLLRQWNVKVKIQETWAVDHYLTKLSKNTTELKFMPLVGYYTNMTTSNFNDLQFVYREEGVKDTFKGCKFHFQHSIDKRKSNFKQNQKILYLPIPRNQFFST